MFFKHKNQMHKLQQILYCMHTHILNNKASLHKKQLYQKMEISMSQNECFIKTIPIYQNDGNSLFQIKKTPS